MNTICQEAARYRWLRSRNSLDLRTSGCKWIRQDGTYFYASHQLSEGGTGHASYETLDETIDRAIEIARERDTGWLQPIPGLREGDLPLPFDLRTLPVGTALRTRNGGVAIIDSVESSSCDLWPVFVRFSTHEMGYISTTGSNSPDGIPNVHDVIAVLGPLSPPPLP